MSIATIITCSVGIKSHWTVLCTVWLTVIEQFYENIMAQHWQTQQSKIRCLWQHIQIYQWHRYHPNVRTPTDVPFIYDSGHIYRMTVPQTFCWIFCQTSHKQWQRPILQPPLTLNLSTRHPHWSQMSQSGVNGRFCMQHPILHGNHINYDKKEMNLQ